ncbi:eIF-2-alpha kinase GCN2 [Colias croceus]|uniref:eIF-2-alpha kinase GCN2 n=1 Tax=Colias crocea TaxID=72248 RepID=UPI001E27D120|nr:eIF-2-alpha kinase GCN2 [Colias croceus]
MNEETHEERQNNELVALQAIYGEAVVDIRKKAAWNGWRPLDILLKLQPLHNSEGVHCSATLQFKCCHNYPDKPPTISINKMNGLSDENANKLLDDLKAMAEQYCGEVMIFQLAQHTQQFLHDHNKPTLSFYDEMLKQKTEMEKLKQHDIQVKENEERQKMKDEIQRRQETLRNSDKRVHRSSLNQSEPDNEGQGDAPKLVYYADDKMSPAKKVSRSRNTHIPCTCHAKGTQIMRYTQRNNKKVYIGNCLGHSANGSTTYLAIDDDGQQVIAKKWCLSSASDFQTRNKQINQIQQDLKAMCRIKHQSLIPYIAMEISTESKKARQFVYIFRSFVLGSSLKYLQNKSRTCGDMLEALKLVRHIALGLYSALRELHSVNVLHRDVRCENVFLEDSGTVKLVGASLDIRLVEVVDGDSYCDRQTKAQDIFAAAQLLLSIVSPDAIHEIPPEFPGSAKDFFSRCLTEDEHTQWSAEQLVKHGFLVDAPLKLPNSKENNNGESESEDEDGAKKLNNIGNLVNGHSRLNAEFEILTWLGKGAFGDVLKVKNKLDGGFYAIKHVKLNPKSVELNKKITREVKLLSRLNHENVVRYYNAWIETIIDTEIEETSISKSPVRKKDSLADVVAKLGQGVKVNWSMSDAPVQARDESSDSEEDSSDDDDDEPDLWFNIMKGDDDSSSMIEFEGVSQKSESTPSEDTTISSEPRLQQVLYIQMEFCEKNTLRQAIDNGLYQEHFRAWRLFREILEGLAHVHQKGMIHRDLKPVNIFLDSNDHVKIGDFGLATKVFTGLPVDERIQDSKDTDGLLTGKVGTTLYVAPELQQSATKVIYNQKVDIYSLGIILFEMFHSPFETGTERFTVLSNLRKREIKMPCDFEIEENSKQIHVIRWLLDHDASLRPTSAELLASEHVPRAVPEGALSGLLSHTLAGRGSRGYLKLVSACLDQRPSAAEDFTYHSAVKAKPLDMIEAIKKAILKIFRSHGAIEFSPPLLTPRASRWDQCPNAVKVMTLSGSVCHLPHDLRLPFARHIAYSGTKYMRRYVVDRVYRETERTVKGFHPREIIECAFDMVTPCTDTLWPDAELLVVAYRAATASSLKVSIQLNHTELLKALLLSCGVALDKHSLIYPVLVDVSLGRITSLQLQTHLATLCVTNRDITNLLRLMEANVDIKQVRDLVAQVRRDKWSHTLERAVRELETVCSDAAELGCECPITVAPFLAYNATQHRGVFWQMSVLRQHSKPAAKHRTKDLIAAGGRYDNLVEEFWKVARAEKDHDNAELTCSSVGFSLSLERMAAILKCMEVEVPNVVGKNYEQDLVCVCVSSTHARACRVLARALWAQRVRAACWAGAGADCAHLTRAALLLRHDHAYVLATCWEGARLREYKVAAIDVVDFVKQKLNPDTTVRNPEYGGRSISWTESDKSNSPCLSVTFITASERITKNSKRHCEVQINNQVTSMLVHLGLQSVLGRVRVNVLALACEAACVRHLAAQLSAPLLAPHLPPAFRHTCAAFVKRQNILEEALDELTNLVKQSSQSRCPDEILLYALYSIPDSLCRLIT